MTSQIVVSTHDKKRVVLIVDGHEHAFKAGDTLNIVSPGEKVTITNHDLLVIEYHDLEDK